MKVHSFYIEEAEKHGVEKAVILYNLRFWLEKNKANSTNIHDGYYWTYNSAKAFAALFPYYKASKIERLLRQMESDGLILSGNYNKAGYDRTKWYSMPDFSLESLAISQSSNMKNGYCKNEECNLQNCSMESSDMKNAICKSEAPIPDSKPNDKPDSKPITCEAEMLVDLWNESRPSNAQVKKSVWVKKVKTRLKTFTADEIKQAMLFLINDQWYQSNSQVLIKNVIDSDERCAKVLEKSSQPAKTNYQGNNHANHQSANHRPQRETQDEYEQRMQREFNQEFGMEVQAGSSADSYS